MSELQTHTKAPEQLQTILQRISMPLLTFSAVLFGLLLISYAFLLPRFTAFHMQNGDVLSPRETVSYQQSLAASLLKQETERVRLVLPITDEIYTALKNEKTESMPLNDLLEQLMQAASRLGEHADAVHLEAVTIEGDAVSVSGDVRNIDTRSMTVLAAYIDGVESLPFVSDFKRPSFTRAQSADGSFHSPFEFSFTVARP